MRKISYSLPIRKKPRKFHKFVPILSQRGHCEHSEYCDACMEGFQAQVDSERPNHIWRVEDGVVHYQEDDVMEKHLGRKLRKNEMVIHKNGVFHDCRIENLEVVEIPDFDGK